MNRKKFLKTLSTIAVVGATSIPKKAHGQVIDPLKNLETKPKNSNAKKAIILGGGLSGLYAAYLLKQTGFETIIIEKGDRLGGRIHTYKNTELGILQDLGGEWIGDGQSDIKSLVRQLNLELLPSFVSEKFNINQPKSDILKISEPSIETLEKVIDLHKSLGSNQKQGLDKINFSAYARYQGISEEEVKSLNQIYRIILGEDLHKISSESVLDDLSALQSALKPKYVVKGGAESIITELTNLLKGQEISLGDPVVKVSQQKNQAVVELSTGKTYKASLVVCTLPTTAVLDIKWTPGLPKDLLYSGLRMQTGKISKNLILCKDKPSLNKYFQVTNTPAETLYLGEQALNSGMAAITSISTGDRAGLIEAGNNHQKQSLLKIALDEYSELELANENAFYFHSFKANTGRSGFVSLFPPGSFGIKEVWFEPFERVFFAGEHLAPHTGSMDAAVASAIQAISKT
ncbi:FAD-dependent oxidoreductase [Leptospira sp. 96542]|nr:FAD-dependent oxidoreductase [Leptospira sp. 96542]